MGARGALRARGMPLPPPGPSCLARPKARTPSSRQPAAEVGAAMGPICAARADEALAISGLASRSAYLAFSTSPTTETSKSLTPSEASTWSATHVATILAPSAAAETVRTSSRALYAANMAPATHADWAAPHTHLVAAGGLAVLPSTEPTRSEALSPTMPPRSAPEVSFPANGWVVTATQDMTPAPRPLITSPTSPGFTALSTASMPPAASVASASEARMLTTEACARLATASAEARFPASSCTSATAALIIAGCTSPALALLRDFWTFSALLSCFSSCSSSFIAALAVANASGSSSLSAAAAARALLMLGACSLAVSEARR
mmetsp:Transcript_60727/g.137288  ORF Transcript_60727/g.137288 Transcript_60727/m.137288 type:complete len:322 (+) Transcript_60727:374-1339(+)